MNRTFSPIPYTSILLVAVTLMVTDLTMRAGDVPIYVTIAVAVLLLASSISGMMSLVNGINKKNEHPVISMIWGLGVLVMMVINITVFIRHIG